MQHKEETTMKLIGRKVKLKSYNNDDPKKYLKTNLGKIVNVHLDFGKIFYLVELETGEIIMVPPSNCEFL